MTPRSHRLALSLVLFGALALGGCGGDDQATPSSGGGTTTAAALLEADLPDAVSVYDAKKKAAGEEVTVFGRVREEVEGLAAFTLIDQAVPYCGEGTGMDRCVTPWDYCCELDKILGASLAVELRGAEGDVVGIDKGDLRRLDLVAIHGTLAKTESGGLMLVASGGWFQRERPQLGDHVEWP